MRIYLSLNIGILAGMGKIAEEGGPGCGLWDESVTGAKGTAQGIESTVV